MSFVDASIQGYTQQSDAAISQVNPVSNTVYTVLDTTMNVKVIGIACVITWAVTQPTNLRVIVTVDGKTMTYTIASPVSTTIYLPDIQQTAGEGWTAVDASQLLAATATGFAHRTAPCMEQCSGRSVKIQVAITWAVTQPTPLVCRVKYAKR